MAVLNRRSNTLKQWLFRAACVLMVTVAVFGSSVSQAYAVGSEAAADVVNERAAAELNRVAGAGTANQIEGAVDGAVGTVKRSVGATKDALDIDSAANKADGATDQLKGKVKRDIGRTQGAAAEAADDVEDTADGVFESIKDFFN